MALASSRRAEAAGSTRFAFYIVIGTHARSPQDSEQTGKLAVLFRSDRILQLKLQRPQIYEHYATGAFFRDIILGWPIQACF